MTKLKQAAKSRKTLTTSIYATLLAVLVANVAANWPMLKGTISPYWWMVGSAVLALATVALRHWQARP